MEPNHELIFLGRSTVISALQLDTQAALRLEMVVAKELLPTWKSSTPSTFTLWVSEMISVIEVERFPPPSLLPL